MAVPGLVLTMLGLAQVLGRYGCAGAGVDNAGAGLSLLPVRQVQLQGGYDAAMRHLVVKLSAVLHDIHAELQDVSRAHLSCWTFLRAFTKSLVVDKSAIA